MSDLHRIDMPQTTDDAQREAQQAESAESREALPVAERLRRAQAEHDFRLATSVNERLAKGLERRISLGDANAEEARKNLDILANAPIIERAPVDAAGVGVTERCTLGEGEAERVAFLKWQAGELAISGTTGEPKKVLRSLREDGTQEVKEVPIHGKRGDVFQRLVTMRAVQREDILEKTGANYGISPEKLPWREDVLGLKRIDVGHSTRAEVAASVVSTAIGFREIPMTAMRFDRHELGSIQMRAKGSALETMTLVDIYEQGTKHPAAPSITRLAALDFLLKSADRHPNNLFLDVESGQCGGIDNGYSNGYSIPNTEKEQESTKALRGIPADKYRSAAMEVVDDNPEMSLTEAERGQMKQLVDEVIGYMKFKEGTLPDAEAELLPEHVLKGQMARLLSETYRMLHERVDEEGKTIPETTAIAKRELQDLLLRAEYLATHGRPPHMKGWQHDRDSLKLIVEKRKKQSVAA